MRDPIAEQLADDVRRLARVMRGEFVRLAAEQAARLPRPKPPTKAEQLVARGFSPAQARRVALWL